MQEANQRPSSLLGHLAEFGLMLNGVASGLNTDLDFTASATMNGLLSSNRAFAAVLKEGSQELVDDLCGIFP